MPLPAAHLQSVQTAVKMANAPGEACCHFNDGLQQS